MRPPPNSAEGAPSLPAGGSAPGIIRKNHASAESASQRALIARRRHYLDDHASAESASQRALIARRRPYLDRKDTAVLKRHGFRWVSDPRRNIGIEERIVERVANDREPVRP